MIVAGHHRVVLLLGEAIVVLAIGSRAAEIDLSWQQYRTRRSLMNSPPQSVWRPTNAKGSYERTKRSAWNTHFWGLFNSARGSVHCVTWSVSTSVKGMLAAIDAAIVADQTGTHLTDRGILPLGEGPDRDLMQ